LSGEWQHFLDSIKPLVAPEDWQRNATRLRPHLPP